DCKKMKPAQRIPLKYIGRKDTDSTFIYKPGGPKTPNDGGQLGRRLRLDSLQSLRKCQARSPLKLKNCCRARQFQFPTCTQVITVHSISSHRCPFHSSSIHS